MANDIHKKIMLVKKLALAFGDRNSSTITVQDIAKGSIVVEWTNNTLPLEPCPREQIRTLSKKIADDSGGAGKRKEGGGKRGLTLVETGLFFEPKQRPQHQQGRGPG